MACVKTKMPGHLDCAVFAGVFPEDKFHLVQVFQQAGHVVGMTGDGVNDAPASKQAEVGIAVANATDVAKAAASLVLTRPGLTDVLAAVETGRCIYQRMLTYTLNKIIKTFQIALFLSLGLLLTGVFVTTPRLILLLLFANDFVTMSLAADRVTFSRKPDRWQIRPLTVSALMLGSCLARVLFRRFPGGARCVPSRPAALANPGLLDAGLLRPGHGLSGPGTPPLLGFTSRPLVDAEFHCGCCCRQPAGRSWHSHGSSKSDPHSWPDCTWWRFTSSCWTS